MAVRRIMLSACAACLLARADTHAQSITAETALTGGYSTDDVTAAAVQLRAFGEVTGGVRFFGEVAWARSSDADNEQLCDGVPVQQPRRGDRSVRRADLPAARRASRRARRTLPHAVRHLQRERSRVQRIPPAAARSLRRVSGISNHFLEHGARCDVRRAMAHARTAIGAPADVGTAVRRSGLDAVARLQAYYGPLIAGVSRIRTSPLHRSKRNTKVPPSSPASISGGPAIGVQLRGEWMPDVLSTARREGLVCRRLVHLIGMGPVTAVARIEQLEYEEPFERGGLVVAPPDDRRSRSPRRRLRGRRQPRARQGDLKAYRPTRSTSDSHGPCVAGPHDGAFRARGSWRSFGLRLETLVVAG